MNRKLFLGVFAAAVAGVLVGVTLVVGQSVFPVRFDDPEPRAVIPVDLGTISADAIRLVPRDSAPFTCDETTEGYLYAWRDASDTNTFYELLTCQCKKDENAGTYSWQFAPKITGSCPG